MMGRKVGRSYPKSQCRTNVPAEIVPTQHIYISVRFHPIARFNWNAKGTYDCTQSGIAPSTDNRHSSALGSRDSGKLDADQAPTGPVV